MNAPTDLVSQARRCACVLAGFLCVALFLGLLAPPRLFDIRLADFARVSAALEAFRHDHGAYPKADFVSNYSGGARNAQWIPGLSPAYLPEVPQDPRGSAQPNLQYLYVSDGKDYKFIAHGPEDFVTAAKAMPWLVDPRRPTWAYGIWTTGAAPW